MGIAKKLISAPVNALTGAVTGLLGGGEKPSAPATPAPTPAAASKTATTAQGSAQAANMAQKEEEDRLKRIIALNEKGGGAGQLTPAGGATGQAPIFRKTLTGQ